MDRGEIPLEPRDHPTGEVDRLVHDPLCRRIGLWIDVDPILVCLDTCAVASEADFVLSREDLEALDDEEEGHDGE